MSQPRPVTDETRADVARLFESGLGRNEIARELGIAAGTVSKIVREAGKSFEAKAMTEVATRVRGLNLAEARLELIEGMFLNGREALESVEGPFLVYNFGGAENTFASELLDEAPLSARREAQAIAGIAVDKLTRVLERDNGGTDDAIGVLDKLALNFQAAAELLRSEDADVDARDGD